MTVAQIAGILPAVVFPAATLVQLVRIVRARTVEHVSIATWLLFGCANLAIYVYAERYAEWQAILGMLVTAVLDFAIVAIVLGADRREPEPPAATPAGVDLDAEALAFAWRADTAPRPCRRNPAKACSGHCHDSDADEGAVATSGSGGVCDRR